MSKACTRCGETKPLDEYEVEKRVKDGRTARCKECLREGKTRNWGMRLEYQRRWNKENRDKNREYGCRWREKNWDRKRESVRQWRDENRDYVYAKEREKNRSLLEATNTLATREGCPWTPEEDAALLAENGMTVYQKAVDLGRTYASCGRRLQRLRSRAHN